MKKEELTEEFEMEFAIENIGEQISEKMEEWKKEKKEETEQELIILLQDRKKIYLEDNETIKKYLKKYNGGKQ